MSRDRIIPLLFFFFFLTPLSSQSLVDSLTSELQDAEGKTKVDILNALTKELRFSDYDQAMHFCLESEKLSKNNNYSKGLAHAQYYLGYLYFLNGKYKEALAESDVSIAIFKELNNSKEIVMNWNLKGQVYSKIGDFSKAISLYEKGLEVSKALEDEDLSLILQTSIANVNFVRGNYREVIEATKGISNAYLEKGDSASYYSVLRTMGMSQRRLGNYPEALSCYFEIAKYETSINRKYHLASIYNSIGLVYSKLDLYDEALASFDKSLKVSQSFKTRKLVGLLNENIGNVYIQLDQNKKADSLYQAAFQVYHVLGVKSLGRVYNNMATAKIKMGEYNEALSLLDTALEFNTKFGKEASKALNYANYGNAYFGLENNEEAEKYFLKALDVWIKLGDEFEKKTNAESLVELYNLTGETNKAKYYTNIANIANDSLFSKKKLMDINRILVKNFSEQHAYDTKLLNQELLASKEKVAQLEKEKNEFSFFSKKNIFGAFFLTFLLFGTMWLLNKRKNQLAINNPEKINTESYLQLQESVEEKNKQLAVLSLEAAQKNDFLEKLNVSIKKLAKKNPGNHSLIKLEKSLNVNQISSQNWDSFLVYFNESYSGFFDRISEKYPTITNKDLRLCALIRLRIPSYEAGIILGISSRSVHKARYRIRKKMELLPESNLDEFICSV